MDTKSSSSPTTSRPELLAIIFVPSYAHQILHVIGKLLALALGYAGAGADAGAGGAVLSDTPPAFVPRGGRVAIDSAAVQKKHKT